ncbi:TAT leader-containing periplasmic protein [Shewanella intestini]|uniref:TAT leader-containing periplasmic protein n=1 Tax=Shewanella intestini TaxID=2017544 RepID=A0ABS5I119_9GAMM|nr:MULTISPECIES: TAT leader-containing periplasmic protein [Shewanella]MBR9727710.1 TAT leader-containing periplasmic protein [Shewanella intestini]MRG35140.1 TAT leader-containing periplasmic protein [Shewanella sp. XMDDZSB0408]
MNRRTFITGAFVSTAALAVGVNLSTSFTRQEHVQSSHRMLFATLIPIFLDGALPDVATHKEQAINRTLNTIEATINVLPQEQREEITLLLNMLESRFSLLLITGSLTPLILRQPFELIDMLESWRQHFITLLNTAYLGLREVIMASYYASPEHWGRLQYVKPTFVVGDN